MTSSPPPAASSVDVIAPFYDLDLAGYEDDIELYLTLAGEWAGPILELGCGTGRVAKALAAMGSEVVGVDLSPAMLAIARNAPTAGLVDWLEGDMRTLTLGRAFALVLVPLGGLQHLETIDDLVATLETVARHLDPDGLAVVDVEAPSAEDFEVGPQPLVEHWTRPWSGGQVTKFVSVDGAPSLSLRHVTWHFDVQADGSLRRSTAQFTMRTFTLGELELAGRLAGLEVAAAHGDYDGSPYDDSAQRLIVSFEHAAALDAEGGS